MPAVDEIANDVELLAVSLAEEFEQFADLRVARAEVNVRDPKRAIIHVCWGANMGTVVWKEGVLQL